MIKKIKAIDIMKHSTIFKAVDYGSDDINHFFVEHINNSNWEEHSFHIFNHFANNKKTMIDIGGWIGATPIYCSYHYKRVVAFEIDSVALSRFKANLGVNTSIKNIDIVEKAITSHKGKQILYAKGSFGDSESSLYELEDASGSEIVDTITFEEGMKENGVDNNDIALIKIDIEGSEKSVIPNMKKWLGLHKPPLYLSLHHHLLSVKEMNLILDILFDIYKSRKIWDKNNNSMEITKDELIKEKLMDCVFTQ